jgi:hypothetical protein
MPGAAGDGSSGPQAYNVFSIALRGGERHANAQSGVSHPDYGGLNNIGNTIETNRADRPDESNLCAAIPTKVAMRSRQNNSAIRAVDRSKALHA